MGRAAPPGRAVGPGPFKFPRPFAIWQPGNFNLLSTCPSFRNAPFRRPRQELNLLLTAKPRTGRVIYLTYYCSRLFPLLLFYHSPSAHDVALYGIIFYQAVKVIYCDPNLPHLPNSASSMSPELLGVGELNAFIL